MKTFTVVVGALLFSGTAVADDLVIYPAEGQSEDLQKSDEAECFIWASDQSGFDPANAVVVVDAPDKKRGGAVRGTALGAAIGDDSDAAKTGAAVGAARQARQNKRAMAAAEKERQQKEAEMAKKREQFNKANVACLEGRGYSVK